jgi:hypothetical protein
MSAVPMEFLINTAEQHDLFGEFLPPAYGAEAARRWAGTPEWAEAADRVLDYALTEWQEIRAEQEEIENRLILLLTDGRPADGPEAMDAAEAHRRHIDRWFHACPPERHLRIAGFVVADASFHARYEGLARGLARYVHDAVVANASRS